MVRFSFRSGEINVRDHSKYIKKALSKTAQTITCSDSIAHFKLILFKSKDDGVITKLESKKLDSIAEDNKTLNLPFIKDMHWAIRSNTARIEGLEANLESLNESINELKRGMKRKLAVESSVGLVGAVLNAISFGIAGSAFQGAVSTTIGNIVDFGDYTHIQNVVDSSNNRELVDDCKRGKSLAEIIRDSEIKDVLKLGLDRIEITADNKLGTTLNKETNLTIITAIACTVSNENHEGTIDIEPSDVNENNGIGDEEDIGFSEDEDETVFDLIDSNDLDGLRAMMDGYSNSEDLKKSFINEKKNALNSLKYAASVKNSEAVDIIGEKAKDFGIITFRKFKKYQAESDGSL